MSASARTTLAATPQPALPMPIRHQRLLRAARPRRGSKTVRRMLLLAASRASWKHSRFRSSRLPALAGHHRCISLARACRCRHWERCRPPASRFRR